MVQHELYTIKTNATIQEINKLNFNEFSHNRPAYCIYGQMTGKCDSERAKELYQKMFDDVPYDEYVPYSKQSFKKGKEFTPLEKYLYMVHSSKHKEIIQYLKNDICNIKL